ncbi:hypothetical protein ROD_23181 [Citrobacter rodentium ICC168]|uniref:Uncharacterized protein n=1 Tax=Citrobacter rodentium (strain ICC168) TaxID=637910 RepID=D2TSA0_CITRI|nr:hypothetical protein ROD_23181 [Citrobacter rodentium ICC168]
MKGQHITVAAVFFPHFYPQIIRITVLQTKRRGIFCCVASRGMVEYRPVLKESLS